MLVRVARTFAVYATYRDVALTNAATTTRNPL